MKILSVENLEKSFGDLQVLKDISLEVNHGEIVSIIGSSGSGKSTLLRCINRLETIDSGKITVDGQIMVSTENGKVQYANNDILNEIRLKTGLVFQNFNLFPHFNVLKNITQAPIRVKKVPKDVAEREAMDLLKKLGLENRKDAYPHQLSGGQAQRVAIARALALKPVILFFDEPTSALDPELTGEFLKTIKKINDELGTTIIISEHDLEEVFPMADRVIVMNEGKVIIDDEPRNVGSKVKKLNPGMFEAMPTPVKIASLLDSDKSPITVKEGRKFIDNIYCDYKPKFVRIEDSRDEADKKFNKNELAVKMKDVWFKYEKDGKDIVKDLSFEVKKGEFFCLVGGNGTGKSTTVSLISGINKPYRGKIELFGKKITGYKNKELFNHNLGILPQDPQSLFVKKTVREDLIEILSGRGIKKAERIEKVEKISKLIEIEDLLEHHPYDLSGGEQQRAALAKVLLLEPQLLILDEPTKGLDAGFKIKFAEILEQLLKREVTIIMVSHDIEFCASFAHKCALFFDGNIVTTNTPNKFFSGNNFYTTVANRMTRQVFENAITCEDVIRLCKANEKQMQATLA